MHKYRKLTNGLRIIIVLQMLVTLVIPVGALAYAPEELDVSTDASANLPFEDNLQALAGPSSPSLQSDLTAEADIVPAIDLNILGAPVAPYDANDIIAPQVFVIHAQGTYTGTVPATNLELTLDYGSDPAWMLLNNEVPVRSKSSLDPGETFNGYWFATYPLQVGAIHEYTVTLTADTFDPIVQVGSIEVVNVLDTGNNGQIQGGAEVIVGVSFAIEILYDLGTNHDVASFNPAGNPDFEPGDYRLLSSKVDFYDKNDTLVDSFDDQLYYTYLKKVYEYAIITYGFIALSPTNITLCPYTMVAGTNYKYDNNYCEPPYTLPITGTIEMEMDKTASHDTILQGETISYTLNYTNNGTLQLQYAWIWDEIDPAFGSVITGTLTPPGDPTWTTEQRAAWYLDVVGAVDDEPPPRSGTLLFDVEVNGGGTDIPDGTVYVNVGNFGVTEDRLPETVALTATATTTVLAPDMILSKTDNQDFAEPGDTFTYTLQVENVGSEVAESLVVTDTLPAYLSLAGSPQPAGYTIVGDQIVWSGFPPLADGDAPLVFKVPVVLDMYTPDQTVLENSMQVAYANRVGYMYDVAEATDTTTVNAPDLAISKTALQDPVLIGDELTYEIQYSNDGHAAATNVVVTDVVPADTTFVSCSDSCDSSTSTLLWDLGTMAPGATGTLTFTVLTDITLTKYDTITNDDYGISADQAAFILGDPVVTALEAEANIIQGKAFWDENGNGLLDAGEVGIEGVEVVLLDAETPLTYTDPEGNYDFRVEVQKAISITAELPAGYFRTTSGVVYLDAILGVTDTVVNFGYAPVDSPWGAVYATVFEDKNANGTQDLGENGISGVELSSTLATTSPLTTVAYGQATFKYETSGTATVTETDPAGYVSTTPNVVDVGVAPGTGLPVHFGDFMGIQMSGMVFDDVNVNGVNDSEDGVAGAVVASGPASFTTSTPGTYKLFIPVDGSDVEITETDPSGYVSTNAVPGVGVTKVDANTLLIQSPTSGMSYTGDFGDVMATEVITISGRVWNDNGAPDDGILANGLKEDDEPWLAGAVVSVSSGLTQTTGATGVFSLYAPAGVAITVTEENPSGYVSTDAIPGPGAVRIDRDTLEVAALAAGSTSSGHLFGDVDMSNVAIVSGYVFDDANENGGKDLGETGFDAVPVTLEIGTINTIQVQTEADGSYWFAVAPGTSIRISTSGPGMDYYPTTPEYQFLTPPAAGTYENINFGYSNDVDTAVIFGIVFDDMNGNGLQDFGELGLPGAVISLTMGGAPVDAYTTVGTGVISGTYTFSVTRPADGSPVVYSLHETNPSGYRSTTPDDINVQVEYAEPSYQVDFGDTNSPYYATVYGIVFDDADKNGIFESPELGIPGVTVRLYDPVTDTYVEKITNAYGVYAFPVENSRTYVVSEFDLLGYISTTPNEVHVGVTLGNSYQVNFGDVPGEPNDFATIFGTVFYDGDGDGIFDPDELGIEGVLITLDGTHTTTTNMYGTYTFSTTVAGVHTVVETDLPGYYSTTPNEVHPDVELGKDHQVDFGDALRDIDQFASIIGTVFNDENANQVWDPNEAGIMGVTVTLDGLVSTVTDIHGSYTFSTTVPGTHTVVETDLVKYISTTPNTVDVLDVVVGEDYTVNFGDKYYPYWINLPLIFQ